MRFQVFAAATLASAVLANEAMAQEQSFVVHHQGRLLKNDDTPVEGVQTITVNIYPSETADVATWTQSYEVVVAKGMYGIALGDTKGQRKPLTTDDVNGERWMSITLGGNEFKPRMRLGAAPFALAAKDALALGGLPAADYLKKADFDDFKNTITGGGNGGITIPWGRIRDVPEDFGAGLRQVAITGTSLAGDGTGTNPIRIQDGGIDSTQLKNASVTAEKLAQGAVTADLFAANSVPPNKLTGCAEGQILKFQSGQWQCGSDVGGGSTLPFDVLAPLEQVAGAGGSSAKLQVKDGGINTVKLANDAVDSTKLSADLGSASKITGGALSVTSDGAIGVGITSPTARLEVGEFPAEGLNGSGSVTYTANATTISGGSFGAVVRPGDSIQLGGLGWRTVLTVPNASTITIDSGYSSAFSGTWTYRRATLRLGQITQSATGNVGIGTSSPTATLDVNGYIKTKNPWFSATATDCWRSQTSGWTEVGWNDVKVNDGSFFNGNTGRFTAPVKGLYMFTATFYHHSNSSSTQASYHHYNIGVNGSRNSGGGQGSSGTYTITAGNSNDYAGGMTYTRMLALNAGDYVSAHVYTSGTGNYMCGYHSLFQGALLFQQ